MERLILFSNFRGLQKGSIQYINDNERQVCRNNQHSLVVLNFFYFIVIFSFLFASKSLFKDWNVDVFYETAVILQIPVMLFVFLRYRKTPRSVTEVNIVCTCFQLYAMLFAGIMCIFPVEMRQPAVYFAPIGLGFLVTFTFTFYQTVFLALFETVAFLIASFLLKDVDVFVVDACSLGLFFILALYSARMLYQHRIRENDARQKIRRMGMIDALTSVYNKASTEFLCKGYMNSHPQRSCVAMILDFDNFKFVNDTYGHQGGDVVLKSFGGILKSLAGEEHIAGRIGGDEFFLFLKNQGPAEAEEVARQVLERTHALCAPDGTQPFSCSIGIAVKSPYGEKENDPQNYKELFARADRALYYVKEHGKNNFRFAE